jgi:hypothetical protein
MDTPVDLWFQALSPDLKKQCGQFDLRIRQPNIAGSVSIERRVGKV